MRSVYFLIVFAMDNLVKHFRARKNSSNNPSHRPYISYITYRYEIILLLLLLLLRFAVGENRVLRLIIIRNILFPVVFYDFYNTLYGSVDL